MEQIALLVTIVSGILAAAWTLYQFSKEEHARHFGTGFTVVGGLFGLFFCGGIAFLLLPSLFEGRERTKATSDGETDRKRAVGVAVRRRARYSQAPDNQRTN
jgi:hypothetical protein